MLLVFIVYLGFRSIECLSFFFFNGALFLELLLFGWLQCKMQWRRTEIFVVFLLLLLSAAPDTHIIGIMNKLELDDRTKK